VANIPQGFELVGEQSAIPQGFELVSQPQPAAPQAQQTIGPLLQQFEAAKNQGDFQTADAIQQQINAMQSGAIGGALEAAGTIATGAIAEPVAGFAGIGAALIPGGRTGAEQVAATREALTFQPRTQEGVEALQATGDVVGDVAGNIGGGLAGIATLATTGDLSRSVDAINRVKEAGLSAELGDKVFEETGSPFLATLAYSLPTASVEAVGVKFTKPARVAARNAKRLKSIEKANDVLSNPQSAKNVEFMVSDGKRVADAAAKSALAQGFDPATVAFTKGASKADRSKFLKMTRVKKQAMDDLRFAAENRPSDVVGDSLAKRVNHIAKVNRSAGSRLDGVASKLEGQKVDLSTTRSSFLDSLADEGVTVSIDDAGKTTLDYTGSTFEGLQAPQDAINSITGRLDRLGADADALQAHRAKRFIDEGITLGGKAGEGLRGRSQGLILELRRGIDDALDSKFRNYRRVNDAYAKTISVLNDFQDAAGKRVNLKGKDAAKAVGQESRKLLSNYNTRVMMSDAIKKMEDVAVDTGLKINDDILSQVMYADILDRTFGVSAQRSLAAETAKGARGAEILTATQEPVTAAARVGAALVDRARGRSPEKAFSALEEILKR
jgi:hypothetical protein